MNIKKTLENYGITSIYHFTDKANLQTIEKYGLQSLKNICNLNIPVNHFGAEEISHILDERSGLDKYVHLAFIKDHPMYHVAKSRGNLINPIWIELDSSILYEDTTLFCDKVANKNGTEIFEIDEILEKINFDILTDNRFISGDEWNIRKEIRKAEIMALNSISANKIKGITYGK
jgi:hypothetical protein